MGRTNFSGPIISVKGVEVNQSIEFFDDFIGAYTTAAAPVWPATPPATGTVIRWSQLITGAAPPTVAPVADAIGGRAALSLTATSEAQQAGLAHNNQRNFLVTNGGVFEARIIVPTLPTLLSKIFIGLAADNVANPDSILQSIWFAITSAGLLVETDDNNIDTSVSTGIVPLTTDVLALRCDFEEIGNVKFFAALNPVPGRKVAWSQVAQTTRFNFAATGANATLQPFLSAAKASGAGLGVVHVDSIYVRTNR